MSGRPTDRRAAPRFETLEPRLLLSADLPLVPLVEPSDLGGFLYERSLLSSTLLQDQGDASVVDRIRSAGAAGGVTVQTSPSVARAPQAVDLAGVAGTVDRPADRAGRAERADHIRAQRSPAYSAAESLARYGHQPEPAAPSADLVLESATLPASGEAGETVTVEWTVSNRGEAATPATGWHDAVYFSRDAALDPSDLRLASVYSGRAESLAPGETATRSAEITLPDHAREGFLIVAADRFGHITEAGEGDNTASSAIRLGGLELPTTALPVADFVSARGGAMGDTATIVQAQANALSDGLATLTAFADRLSEFAEFAQDLPLLSLGEDETGEILGVALGEVFGEYDSFSGLGASLQENLVEPIQDFLASASEFSSDDLIAELEGLASVAPGSVAGGVFDATGDQELRFDLVFSDQAVLESIPLFFGAEASDLGLAAGADAAIALEAGVMFDFSFGVSLDESLAAGDAFFVRSGGLTLTGAFAADTLDFGASVGFLDVAVEGAQASLAVSAGAALQNPDGDADGRVTGSELAGSDLADLVAITPGAAPYSLTLPISAEVPGLAGASSTITLSGDAFDGMAPAVNLDSDFDDFGAFVNIDAQNFGGLIDQLGAWFGDVALSDLFGAEIPFTGTTVGEILDFGFPFESLADTLISPETGEASFDSVQTLETVLAQVLGEPGEGDPGIANLAYDPATSELTFDLRIEAGTADTAVFQLDPISEELAFDYELPDGLGGISTAATLGVGASAVFMLTAGVRLERLGAGVPRLTDESRLDEIFRAFGDDVVGIRTTSGLDVRVETRDGGSFEVNLSAADDIGDVLGELNRDGVIAQITEDGYALELLDTTEGDGRFKISPAQDGAFAATDLGINLQDLDDDGLIVGTPLHGDTLLERFFLRDTSVEAGVEFTADDVSASARFGFLELALGGEDDPGSVSLDLGVAFGLNDAARGSDALYLSELYEAFSENDLASVVNTPAFTGTAMAVLPVSGVLGDAVGALAGDPRVEIEFDLADIGSPGEISAPDVSLEGFDELLDFRDLSIDDVLGALTGAVDFLTTFETFDFLDTDLPLIDRSVADLLDLATQFNEFVAGFTSTDDDAATPTLLTNLEARLDDALASITFTDADATIEIDRSGAAAALKLGITFSDRFEETLPLDFDVVELLGDVISLPEQVGSLVSASAGGELFVSAGYEFTLDLGIDLGDLTPFLYGSTGFSADLLVGADDINVEVGIGPLQANIVGGTADISQDGSGDPVLFEYGVVGGDDARVALSAFGLSDLGVESAPVPGVSVDLPVELFGVPTGSITLMIDNLASSSPNITGSFPDISDALSSLDLVGQLNVLVDALDLALTGISDVLNGEILGITLPLVGDNLSGAATFVDDFRAATVGELADALDEDPSGGLAFEAVADALESALGSGGLDFLRGPVEVSFNGVDPDDNTDPVEEITFEVPLGTTFDLADLPPVGFDLGFPGLSLDLDAEIELGLTFGWDLIFGVDTTSGFFFDVSASPAPASGLTQPEESVGAGSSAQIVETNQARGTSAELFLEFTAEAATLDAEGTLAILRVLASDLGDGTPALALSALFGLDIVDPSGDGKLTFSELASGGFSSLFDPVIAVSGDADLELQADFGGLSEDLAAIFPSVVTDLGFSASVDALAGDFSVTRLEFNYIRISAGDFFNDFLLPIVQEINGALEPFDPFLDAITSPVPVISDLRGDDTSLADLAIELGSAIGLNLGWIEDVLAIRELISDIAGLDPSGLIPYGNIDLTGFLNSRGGEADADFSTLDLDSYLSDPANGEVMDAEAAAMSTGLGSTLSDSGDIGLSFPILSDPLSAFGLLLGQDADLFVYNMSPLIFQFNFSSFFSVVGPIGVRLSGSIGAEVNLGFGYDTSGIRRAVDLIDSFGGGDIAPFAGQVAFAVLDGFFLIDRVENGSGQLVERTEARLYGSLSAAIELNIIVAAAGVEGGIEATFNADLNDLNDDGKVRLSEIIEIVEQTDNFACLFEFSGKLEAFLDAYARVGFPPLGKRWDYELARVTLLSFSFDCALNDPVLAGQSGDVLTLHMGPNAGLREFGDTTDTAENFSVRQIAPGVMQVSAFDLTQNYGSAANPIREIRGQGGFAQDVITIDASVTARTRLFGGFEANPAMDVSDDELYGGSGDNLLDGGAGDDSLRGGDSSGATDTLLGGAGVDTIFGRRGPDIIVGGSGNDLLYGDLGDDNISGDDGADEIYGGAGNDVISGGDDVDSIFGEAGDDEISGRDGDDALFGGLGADLIQGGDGRDTIDGLDLARGVTTDNMMRDIILGGDGVDIINATGGVSLAEGNIVIGGLGEDRITTGAGNDLIFGDLALAADAALGGADIIDSGAGDDEIRGGAGSDTINAGSGNDVIFGALLFETASAGEGVGDFIDAGSGDDDVFGSALDDQILGGAGADRLLGGAGRDEIRGQDGDDVILGGLGDDLLFGDRGMDEIFGEGGVDEIRGGAENDLLVAGTGLGDQLLGGLGDDRIFGSDDAPAGRGTGATGDFVDGGAGNDRIFTFAGIDEILGGTGDDVIHSGLGADFVDAGAGDDFVYAGPGDGDTVFGREGLDEIYGSDDGGDTIDGGAGEDMIFGQGGGDLILGQGGADFIDGGAGEDEIRGGDGDDVIVGGGWSDLIFGDAGDDDITGSADGDDEIYGGLGNDTIRALGSNDFVDAGLGDDDVDGGAGDDLIYGDGGVDALVGGADHDVIYGYRAQSPSDDGAADLIYGDGGDGAERDTDGRDRLYGGAGPDELYGQGEDDFLDPGPGATDLVDYGSGERPIQEDFVQPLETPSVPFQDRAGVTFEPDALPATPVVTPPALPTIPAIEDAAADTELVRSIVFDLSQTGLGA